MSDSSNFSRQMHELLDEILAARQALAEAVNQTPDERLALLSNDAVDVFAMAADLMAQLVVEPVSNIGFGEFPEADDPDKYRWNALSKLAQKLNHLIPVLGAPNWEWWVSNFVHEVYLLHKGDEPDLLKPAARKTGQGKYPARIALMRLQAIQWNEFLKLKGVPLSEREKLIAAAYRTNFDTIRKWVKSAEMRLGKEDVQSRLAGAKTHGWASSSFFALGCDGRLYLTAEGKEALQANGDEYWVWWNRSKR